MVLEDSKSKCTFLTKEPLKITSKNFDQHPIKFKS